MKKRLAYEKESENSVFTVSKKFNILSSSLYYIKTSLTSNSKYSIYRHQPALLSCIGHSGFGHDAKIWRAMEGKLVLFIQYTATDTEYRCRIGSH